MVARIQRRQLSLPILTTILLVLSSGGVSCLAQDRPPNIVFILADDMGYGDVRALNPESKIDTPYLDRLAAEGMTFTDAHSPSAVCTPTRYGLLTGRYCWRSRLKRGVLNGYSPPLIESDRPTVASTLRDHGYHTGIVGKWHLGLDFSKLGDNGALDFSNPLEQGPNVRGFDFSYIIPASLDFPPYVYIRNGHVTSSSTLTQVAQKFPAFLRQGERATDLVMENCLDDLLHQAMDYIHRRSKTDKPYFLYFPLTAPHKPVLPHARFRGKTGLGPYADFIAQVDWTVGQVVQAVDDSEHRNNTLVIYTSDNGSFMRRRDKLTATDHVDDETVQAYKTAHHSANYVFRGTKADIWEAGHRVPFLARWPERIMPDSRCHDTICLTDFFATAIDILGAQRLPAAAEDSYSFLAQLIGETPKTERPPVIHHSANGMFAIRQGKWKLVLGNGSGGRANPKGKPFQRPYQLFDLAEDPSERNDLIDRFPEMATKLEDACASIRAVQAR